MTLKFNPRNYRHLPTGGVTELHIRMSVGRGAVQRSKTKILVDPTLWDSRGQCIKARCISCPEAEKIKIKDEVTALSNYIYNKYVVIENSGSSLPEKWLEDIVTQYYAEKEVVKKVRQTKAKSDFDLLFEKFLSSRNLSIGRVRHYRIVQGMVHRFEKYVQISGGKKGNTLWISRASLRKMRRRCTITFTRRTHMLKYTQTFSPRKKTDVESRAVTATTT